MTFQEFQETYEITGKPRTWLIIIMFVLALVIGIVAAVMSSKSGDKECQCLSPANMGFRAFGITMTVCVPLMMITFIFFGCTTNV